MDGWLDVEARLKGLAERADEASTRMALSLPTRSKSRTIVGLDIDTRLRRRLPDRRAHHAANPAAQYLGVGDDGEYAIFVLGPKATAGRELQDTLTQDAVTASALGQLRYSTITGTVGLTSAP